jgi:hypothetical protein
VKDHYLTLIAGAALIIPASLGLLLSGVPTVLTPFPTLTILPAFLLGRSYGLAVLVPALLFFAWNPGLFRGQAIFPKRSIALLGILTALSGLYFTDSWKYGLQYQGARFTYAVCLLNVVWLVVLWSVVIATLRKSSFATNLLLNWVLFAWLGWYAFPYLGELP